jgi:LacI family transcriptional regulator
MPRPRHVALLIETSNAYARGLLRGVMAYVQAKGPWALRLSEHGRGEISPRELADWRGHGVIARVENPRIADVVRASGLPAVDLSAARLLPQIPWVESDDAAVARLAAEHLLDRGLQHFGFCGDHRFNWSKWRQQHFQERLAQAGFKCSVGPSPRRGGDELAAWLRDLPKPAGILACYDIRGREVLDACRRAAIAVPDEIAVIGVDDDELLCELSDPPLSSVVLDTRRTGWVAAELLAAMMAGRSVRPEARLILPLGVTTRRSTDTLAIEDADIRAAVRFIRDHACEGIGVADVVTRVPLSRRVLEARFEKLLGRTPHAEILRVRLERAKALLARDEWSLETIARHTGFKHGEYLSAVFKREFGETPGRFRQRRRR